MTESKLLTEIPEYERKAEFIEALLICSARMSLPLYLLFWLADLVYAPALKWQFLGLRLLMIPATLFVNYWARGLKTLHSAQMLGAFFAFANSSIITYMIAVTSGPTSPYYAGLNLVSLGILAFFPWTRVFIIGVLFVIFAPYYLIVVHVGMVKSEIESLYLNTFFIVGTAIASLVVRSFRETLKRNEFQAKQSLKQSNEELTNAMGKLKSAQAELIHSEKMASLGVLSAGISHELNNTLNSIGGSLSPMERLLSELEDSERKTSLFRLFALMETGVNLSADIIQNLRNYSVKDSVTLQRLVISEIIDTVLGILRPSIPTGVEIVRNIPSSYAVHASHAGLNQLLMNLIKNSIDAVGQHGRIEVTVRDVGDSWCLEIADNGEGISKENMGKIYDPFFTTKEIGKGTGLGLSIVQTEVQRHKANLSVESELGNGTKFSIVFPKAI